jgi:hypothetical protein
MYKDHHVTEVCEFTYGYWVSPFKHNHFFAKLKGTDSDIGNILHIQMCKKFA